MENITLWRTPMGIRDQLKYYYPTCLSLFSMSRLAAYFVLSYLAILGLISSSSSTAVFYTCPARGLPSWAFLVVVHGCLMPFSCSRVGYLSIADPQLIMPVHSALSAQVLLASKATRPRGPTSANF